MRDQFVICHCIEQRFASEPLTRQGWWRNGRPRLLLVFWRLPLHPERCCDHLGIFSAEVSRCLLGRLLHGEVDRVSRTASVDSPTSKSVPSAPRESLNLRNAAFNSQGITFPCRLHARRWIVIMHAIISPGAKATPVSGSCTQTCAHLRTCSEGLVSRRG